MIKMAQTPNGEGENDRMSLRRIEADRLALSSALDQHGLHRIALDTTLSMYSTITVFSCSLWIHPFLPHAFALRDEPEYVRFGREGLQM